MKTFQVKFFKEIPTAKIEPRNGKVVLVPIQNKQQALK